ncbi:MAG: molecular chaperone TorD family protein [Dissulfurispiraceae bacterium]|nr:molecular chaperone TorD family protein [Dissulfurispiraceae bacterium]
MVEKENDYEEIEIDLDAVIQAHADIYAVLARGFSLEPDEKYLDDLKRVMPWFQQISETFYDDLLFAGVKDIQDMLAVLDRDELIQDIQRQFAALFLTGIRRMSVNPCESVYLSAERLVMQEQRDESVEFYARFGMGVTEEFKEPEDHIGAQLSFMSGLSMRALSALRGTGEDPAEHFINGQVEFIRLHLIKWLPLLHQDIHRVSASEFYKKLVDITYGFIRTDLEYLEEIERLLKAA